MNKKIADNIKKIREEKHISQQELGSLLNISGKTISSWEIGRTEPNMGYIQSMCDIFNISIDELIYGSNDKKSYGLKYKEIPLYSPICCGNGGFAEDNIIEYIPVPGDGLNVNKEYFAQYAKGNSMADRIEDGDLLVFEKTSIPEVNKIGCFCIDENEAMCKQYKVSNGVPILVPLNREYEPIVVDSTNFRCIGLLKKVIKNF